MVQSRIYLVNTPNGNRLIRASVKQQAISHAANSIMTARVASQNDLVDALASGIKVEDYKDSSERCGMNGMK